MPEIEYLGPLEEKELKIEYLGPLEEYQPVGAPAPSAERFRFPVTAEMKPPEVMKPEAPSPRFKPLAHTEAQLYTTAAAINRGLASFWRDITEPGQYVAEKLTGKRSEVFDRITREIDTQYAENAAFWQDLAKQKDTHPVDEFMGTFLGTMPTGVASFILGRAASPFLGAAEARAKGESEAKGALLGGLKRALMGKLYGTAAGVTLPARVPLLAGVGAAEAVGEGVATPEEIAEAAATGAGIALVMGPRGRPLAEIREPIPALRPARERAVVPPRPLYAPEMLPVPTPEVAPRAVEPAVLPVAAPLRAEPRVRPPAPPVEAPSPVEALPARPPRVAPPPELKIWQQPLAEYLKSPRAQIYYSEGWSTKELSQVHRDIVREAYEKGESVPFEVVADYPELARKPVEPTVVAPPELIRPPIAPVPPPAEAPPRPEPRVRPPVEVPVPEVPRPEVIAGLRRPEAIPAAIPKEPWEIRREDFLSQSQLPAPPEYTTRLLSGIPLGNPGLSSVPHESGYDIVYRDPKGVPIGVAFVYRIEGKLEVDNFAVDKTRGLLTGRAVQAIGQEIERVGAAFPTASMTPDAAGFFHHWAVQKALSEGKSVPPEVVADYPELARKPVEVPPAVEAPLFPVPPAVLNVERYGEDFARIKEPPEGYEFRRIKTPIRLGNWSDNLEFNIKKGLTPEEENAAIADYCTKWAEKMRAKMPPDEIFTNAAKMYEATADSLRPSKVAIPVTEPTPILPEAALSAEELARTEKFFLIKKNDEISYLGKRPDATMRPGDAIVAADAQGNIRVQDSNAAGTDAEVMAKTKPILVRNGLIPPTPTVPVAPTPPITVVSPPEITARAEVRRRPTKTISEFTEEYKEPLGEAGFVAVPGVPPKVRVVTPGARDVTLPEFGLVPLYVGDRHPDLKPIIEMNIKAEQDTNNWIMRHSENTKDAFDRVEKPSTWRWIFGRKGTNIRDLDLMIERKKPIPQTLAPFVDEIRGIIGGIKGEIIQKTKDDFRATLSPAQQRYLDWEIGGRTGSEPTITVAEYSYVNKKGRTITVPEHERPVSEATKAAVREALDQFEKMEGWGITDYFPHIFKGRFKYLDEKGGIIASGTTAKQAKANFDEFVQTHPEAAGRTFMFVNDFYDLLTVRKALNPELTNPLEYLGTRLSRKEFFRLVSRTEDVIEQEIKAAGVADVPKVKVDMSGIASLQRGRKFSGHFLKRKTSLRGEEMDPFRALMSYIFSVGRKLGLEDAKMRSYSFADSLPANMPHAKSYIKMQADNMSGRYNMVDRLFDETIGEKLGLKPFGVTRLFSRGVRIESKLKLGYAPAKTAINRIGGVFHIVLQEGAKNYNQGKAWLKDPEFMERVRTEGHLAGMEQLFAGEGLVGVSAKQMEWWRALGPYQRAEIKNRTEALAAGYNAGLKKFKGDKDAAWIYAIDSAKLTQGLYNISAKPVIVRGPILQAQYQFKQYVANEMRFLSQLTPRQWAAYISGIVAMAGTRGTLLTLKSIIGISVIGLGIDELMERLNMKAPHLHRGVFGLVGIDVSAPASWQIPSSVRDWLGVFPNDIIETGEMIVKGLQNHGWTDEEISHYVRQITPVGYNILKGFQLLSEGYVKEGTKVIYRGGKEEGVINLMGARSVSQSRASDSVRYMNQQRQLMLNKTRVLEDKLFRAGTAEDAAKAFKELVELKNIQTAEEFNDLVAGLRRTALSRTLTQEARTFMTLPKVLRKREIERRQ